MQMVDARSKGIITSTLRALDTMNYILYYSSQGSTLQVGTFCHILRCFKYGKISKIGWRYSQWFCNYKFAPFIWADIFLSYFGANVLRVCIYKFAYRWLYNKVILLIITVQIYQGENLAKILIPGSPKTHRNFNWSLELPSRWSTWLFGLPKIGWKAQQSPRSVFWTIPSIKKSWA